MIGPIERRPVEVDRTDKEAAKSQTPEPQAPAQARRADSVDISAEGRALAAGLDDVEGLSPERVAEIREKIADGTYDSPEVLDAVVRRMIERGDV